ncbi:elongation factor Ts [Paucidesulfovibrio gracilis DSM 16080]|uniref:Elongation factor Ts n=1 Tax=Paucidesulfovibrio gracilis DSM 16080 TaxID=1121449 RepID=A0A1T4WDH1_9BACT|nr:translation elongation factor Ts [Paucidesulfovibrio gracilis]SKA74965.1 elongation factor Ts [Paucidesulfovibrio gracilis DSM 16080]
MAITAAMVKDLREQTGAGMMDCKKALVEADGDIEQAVVYLREKGLAKAAKKAGRATSEGTVGLWVADDGASAALAELLCETDFAAKNEEFVAFAKKLAADVAKEKAESVDSLSDAAKDLTPLVSKIGENLQIGRLATLSVDGLVGSYVHANGKIGVLVALKGAKAGEHDQLAKDIAMQVAAANPLCVCSDQVPQDKLDKEKEIYKAQAMEEGKPEQIAEKIVLGRINKYYKEVCLLDQPFIKEDKKAVKDLLSGTGITIEGFARLALGEGCSED